MASSEYSSNFTAKASLLRRLFDKSKFAISTEEQILPEWCIHAHCIF